MKKIEDATPPIPAQDRSIHKLEKGFTLILEGLGLNPENSDHLKGTPERAAKAWWEELCSGLTSPPPKITTFRSELDQMVLLRGIPVKSLCAHHLLPFIGTAAVAYTPGTGRILGLSKLSRIVDHWARRPQVQEELTEQIANAVAKHVIPTNRAEESEGGVGVVIRANHMCMELRGVKHRGDMVTSAVRGLFKADAKARAEFLDLARDT